MGVDIVILMASHCRLGMATEVLGSIATCPHELAALHLALCPRRTPGSPAIAINTLQSQGVSKDECLHMFIPISPSTYCL